MAPRVVWVCLGLANRDRRHDLVWDRVAEQQNVSRPVGILAVPEVVVLNLRLGEQSGLGLLRRVKFMCTGMPVFMLDDYFQLDAAVTAMKIGASDVISKPIDPSILRISSPISARPCVRRCM